MATTPENLYGRTAADVRDVELAYQAGNVDTTLLQRALYRACHEFNNALGQWVDDVSSITASSDPSGYEWCAAAVGAGAAAYYGWFKIGTFEGYERFAEAFNQKLKRIQDKPNHLEAVRTADTTAHRASSHATDETQDTIDAAFDRMDDPTDKDQWLTT